MQEYISYIEEQIKFFQKNSVLNQNNEITPLMINTTLANYCNVGVALIGEYNRKKYALYNIQKEYDKWYGKKFYAARKKMTSEFEGKTIKLAVKEIENLNVAISGIRNNLQKVGRLAVKAKKIKDQELKDTIEKDYNRIATIVNNLEKKKDEKLNVMVEKGYYKTSDTLRIIKV